MSSSILDASMDQTILRALGPVVVLLFLGVAAAVASRAARTSPIVGYLLLGVALNAAGLRLITDSASIQILAELGVIFLLFDIGLHFSLKVIRDRWSDIFGFGPVQVLLGTGGLALASLAWGMKVEAALVLGGVLALSSTAVVAKLIAERHQQNCPVGQTATAILVFQDVAAIFLLIIANALGGGALGPAIGLAVAKGAMAFGIALLTSRLVTRPLMDLVAKTGSEEAFTAVALLLALAAGWASGTIGLSLTLGAFLGGMTLADTPYRPTVAAEIKPFRGLLLGFFFISVGSSLDLSVLVHQWPAVVLVLACLLIVKILTNVISSLIFRWSVPGSTQLGFLIAQGSEFAFVILSLPAIRTLVGERPTSIVIAAVAASLAVTPTLASAGRTLAGRMRRHSTPAISRELTPTVTAPVMIVGMGRRGRAVADALRNFDVAYTAVERDPKRLRDAVADGYPALFADTVDPRHWGPIDAHDRLISVMTAPSFEEVSPLAPFVLRTHPNLKRIAAVASAADADRFRTIGVEPVLDGSDPPGIDLAERVLEVLGIDSDAVARWAGMERNRAIGKPGEMLAVA
jgi:monovalent cation:H+ antiporter-2, CPA2 family